jgi:hypothetical protein
MIAPPAASGLNQPSYKPSSPTENQSPSFTTPADSFKPSPAMIREKEIMDVGRTQAALNYLNFQMILGKRLQQLAQAPLTVATLPMGEFRQLSEAIDIHGGHPHHPPFPPPFPPPFCFPPPPPMRSSMMSEMPSSPENPPTVLGNTPTESSTQAPRFSRHA